MCEYIAKYGLKPKKVPHREEFVFGDGKVDTSMWYWEYPVVMKGKIRGTIKIAECTVPCPCLFSLEMAEQWEASTNHKNHNIHLGLFDITIPFQDNTPLIDVCDYGDSPDLQGLPAEFFMNEH